uniref:Uncharacterized protein n=1 Tax=Rhabditophanes sp. KR3021 TaxID=114890 RepID=A0AC35U859_9BILA
MSAPAYGMRAQYSDANYMKNAWLLQDSATLPKTSLRSIQRPLHMATFLCDIKRERKADKFPDEDGTSIKESPDEEISDEEWSEKASSDEEPDDRKWFKNELSDT